MARKTKPVAITEDGRDRGKCFVITEMPASQCEAWAIRAFGAMSRAGVQVPEEAMMSGMVGVSAVGLKAFLASDWADVESLLAEMMACVQFMPDPKVPDRLRKLIEDDIEEPATRVRLRDEVFQLHTGFSMADVLLKAAALALRYLAAGVLTQTSTDESEQLSLLD